MAAFDGELEVCDENGVTQARVPLTRLALANGEGWAWFATMPLRAYEGESIGFTLTLPPADDEGAP